MRRFADFMVTLLALDHDGRRAVDETLADWRHEATLARSWMARTRVAADGLTAVASVLARTAAHDLGRLHTYRIAAATLGLSLLFGLPTLILFLLRWPESLSSAQIAFVIVSLLPTVAAVSLPLAALTPPFATRRSASVPVMGTAVTLMLLAVLNVGWLSPRANQTFREFTASIANASTGARPGDQVVSPRGSAELTGPELITRVGSNGRGDSRAWRTLHTRGMLVLMIPVCLILGTQARRLTRLRGWRSGGALLAWAVLSIVWGSTAVVGDVAYQVFREQSAASETFLIVGTWATPIACTLAAGLMSWLATLSEPEAGEASAVAG